MIQNHPEILNSFTLQGPLTPEIIKNLFFECTTTKEIASFSQKKQSELTRELTLFFSKIFKNKNDWEYMVRHFFYIPRDNTVRQAIFVRNRRKNLIALAAFDNGTFSIEGKKTKIIYIHIRAVLPEFHGYGIGRVFSEKILNALKPDMLLTTCVQLSSFYSWTKINDPELLKKYTFLPRVEEKNCCEQTVSLPHKDLDFTMKCFRKIYKNHVKESKKRLEQVINNITIHMVRKGVDTFFNYNKWDNNGKRSKIAEDLGITEQDALLLVVKKKGFCHNTQKSDYKGYS